jgi:hypothetical protein
VTIGARLWIERPAGAARAHPVLLAGPAHRATIDGRRCLAILVRKVEAQGEGARLVPLAHVTEAAPLSAAEEAEYARLDAALAGTHGEARKLARFNALRLRSLLFPSPPSGHDPADAPPPSPYPGGGAPLFDGGAL